MSQTVSKTLLIGAVNAYWSDARLGSAMGTAAIRRSIESVQYGLTDAQVNVGSRKTKEIIEIDIVVADFKLHQMQLAYGQAESIESSTTIFANGYTSSFANFVHRFKEEVMLTAETAVTLNQAGWETGTINIFNSEYSNTPDGYTRVTDWTGTSSVGTIQRVSGGSISDGDVVMVEYNQSATSAVNYVGGKLADYEGELRLSHQCDDGKYLTITAYRAKRIGASDFAIQMATEFGGIAMTFHCLADMSKVPGKQIIEAGLEN